MHIGTTFLSPEVWGTMALVSGACVAGSLAVAGRRLADLDERKVPLMGVMGAFVFAAQMVNFPVLLLPGTSGHLAGGLLLGILLGAPLGIVVMASVLSVQALVFQDGGIDTLGANLFTMGIIGCVLGAIVRPLWTRPRPGRLADVVTFAAGVVGVLAGATAVVVLLWCSGKIPAGMSFAWALYVMDGTHVLIGVVEGLASVAVVRFVLSVRRDAVVGAAPDVPPAREPSA
jgi:cobalt/nickel transport system permease protein